MNMQSSSAMIDEAFLRKHHARLVMLAEDEVVFNQGDPANDFHILKRGKVKMVSLNEEGKEFVQGYFTDGQSFGEPPFFKRSAYPASAVAVEKSSVWKCPREPFLQMLRENFDLHISLTQALSERLIYKSMMLSEIAVEEAEHRLTTLIGYLRKATEGRASQGPYVVPFTRQQLADMTGLRVETVIRCVKSMERSGKLDLGKGGKIVWRGKVLKQQP